MERRSKIEADETREAVSHESGPEACGRDHCSELMHVPRTAECSI